jgi:hypothetical protein
MKQLVPLSEVFPKAVVICMAQLSTVYNGHSLRACTVTYGAAAGLSFEDITRRTHHRSQKGMLSYLRMLPDREAEIQDRLHAAMFGEPKRQRLSESTPSTSEHPTEPSVSPARERQARPGVTSSSTLSIRESGPEAPSATTCPATTSIAPGDDQAIVNQLAMCVLQRPAGPPPSAEDSPAPVVSFNTVVVGEAPSLSPAKMCCGPALRDISNVQNNFQSAAITRRDRKLLIAERLVETINILVDPKNTD